MKEANKMNISRNSIIWADLGNNKGHIQSGYRPCIVVSCDKANRYSPVYTVIPGTTQYDKADFPVHCIIEPNEVKGILRMKTIFLAEQICTIDKKQVLSVAGKIVNQDAINQVNKILIRQLELENSVDGERRGK